MEESKKKGKKSLTKDEAIAKLWEMGELSFLLNDMQKEIKNTIINDTSRTSVIVASRRLGKSFLLVTLALETCLRSEGAIVKFLLPKMKDAKTIIKDLMRQITETCPKNLRPEYNTQDKIYYFPHNGSEIHLGGSDLGAESLRGTRANLVIVDEAGFVNDLDYSIKSVLSPTIRTTGGRMILASTPSRDPQHEFVQLYMNPYKAAGRLKIYDIYSNLNFTPEIIQEIISEYPLGTNDPNFRREYLCIVEVDEKTSICPEYSHKKDDLIITEYKVPEFVDFYVSADIGFKDLTVVLFGYYDFNEATLYILDELVMNGPEMTTEYIAKELKHKEKLLFHTNGNNVEPYLRVMDVDLKLINDLNLLHGIQFIATRKDNREAAINEMRMWVGQGRIKIHEKCTHLRYHLEFGQWNGNRSDFQRLPDTPDRAIRGGHVDAIPALYYLIRNVQKDKNPFPFGFGNTINSNTFRSPKSNKDNQASDFMKKLLGIKK